jgi:adenylate cyclase class 2
MTSEGPRERELKFAAADHDALRRRLEELGARRVSDYDFEDNRVFDRRGELKDSRSVLRLRTDRKGNRLTFKGPPSFEQGVKVRLELESRVEEAEQVAAILGRLGFEAVTRYQKRRQTWQLGEVMVALDRTPIGDFAEFEGGKASAVARACGLDPDVAEERSYLELYRDWRRHHPDASSDMVFP